MSAPRVGRYRVSVSEATCAGVTLARGASLSEDVTRALNRWSAGDPKALDELLPLVYAELRRLARRAMKRERADHTLQPTALVHEAFLRLVPQREKQWQNRSHFYAVAAQAMRQVLVDHARRHRSRKRTPDGPLVELNEETVPGSPERWQADLLELDRTLDEFATVDAPRARIVELRYFGGLSIPEIAGLLNQPEGGVKRDWTLAKAWLRRRLEPVS
jgi:RNA polymerase sigma factor (TIGR02999 family)